MNRRFAGIAAVLALLSVASCGRSSGPAMYDVSGAVTFDGKPLPMGRMTFVPDSRAGNTGPAGHADIADGRFDTRHGGRGTVGGPHLVYIDGYGEPQTVFDADAGENVTKPVRLFSAYEQRVELPNATATMDFEVPASAAPGAR